MAGGTRTHGSCPPHGFTVLELLVVIGVISILMGFGIGFLQRGSTDLDAGLAIVRDQLRIAANTAKARNLPTEVHIGSTPDGVGVQLEASVLVAVGFWHMEEGERWFDVRLRPTLTGERVPNGRFGAARRPDPDGRGAMLSLSANDPDLFDLSQGFAVRLDLELEERVAMNVVRLGRAFELLLTDDLQVEGRVTTSLGSRPGDSQTVRSREPLPSGRWVTVELVHDGRTLSLIVDGREQQRAPARGEPFQQPADLFEVSYGGAPVRGLVDEVQLLAYERDLPAALPADVELRGLQGPVRFGRRGELLTPARFELVFGEDSYRRMIAPGGVLRPWSKATAAGGKARE